MLVTFALFCVTVLLGLVAILWRLWPGKPRPSTVPGLEASDEKLGNIGDITQSGSFHEFLVSLHARFGPVASFWFGSQYCVSVANHKGFKDIVQLFNSPPILFEFARPLVGDNSIQFQNGLEWKETSKILSAPFNHSACVQLLTPFNKICQSFCDNWSTLPPEEHIPLHEYMMALAIKLITSTQFGAFFKSDKATLKFHNIYEEAMSDLDSLLVGDLTPDDKVRYSKLENDLKIFKNIVKEVIDKHKEARESGDYEKAPFLDTLLDHFGDDDETVLSQAISYIVGGFHTTGNFLTWCFHYLSVYPEIQDKVHQEIQKVMGDRKDLTEEDIKKLKYTTQFMEETLRVSVTAPFAARFCDREMRLCGHLIPPNTPIVKAIGVSLSDEENFPKPNKFDPDRFSAENVKSRPPQAFVPFGVGARKCPGYKFSYYEAYAALVPLVIKFRFYPAEKEEGAMARQKFGFVTKPEEEIWITIKKRS